MRRVRIVHIFSRHTQHNDVRTYLPMQLQIKHPRFNIKVGTHIILYRYLDYVNQKYFITTFVKLDITLSWNLFKFTHVIVIYF